MKNIVIFGAGATGSIVLNIIGNEKVLCFADNYPKSKSYMELPVVNFEELKTMYSFNPEMIIIVASYDYFDEISAKLSQHNMGRFYVWPMAGVNINNAFLDRYSVNYFYYKMFVEYNIFSSKSIAIYSYAKNISFLLQQFTGQRILEKIKYIICCNNEKPTITLPNTIHLCNDLSEVEDKIDMLVLNVRRADSKFHDYTECNKLPYNIADLRNCKKFLTNNEIKQYKNRHASERCFVIGNGKSLLMNDLDRLKQANEICFGLNKIFYAFEDTQWRPDYYLAQDTRVLMYYSEEINNMDVPVKFIADRYPPYWDTNISNNTHMFHIKTEVFSPNMPEFSMDFSAYSVEGFTVMYSALQLAVYMGFKRIYLLGVDNDYSGDIEKSESHFSPKYHSKKGAFGKNTKELTLQVRDKVLDAYKKAVLCSKINDFEIFNATRGGKLEVFERVDFDDVLKLQKPN
jgi:hypothetical protein